MKKIYVMIGNYGSGKSELALNFAFKAAETGKTELIDLDLVNTYFRLTERGKLVEQKEIRLISPNYACSGVETLSLPAELRDGYEMLREVSDRTGVPVMYTTGKKDMLDIFLAEGHDPKYIGKPVAIDIIMKRDWESYIHSLSEKKQA